MSSVLRAGMAALRDRSFGVFVAPAAPADGNGDDIPTVPWSAPAPAQWWAAASAADVRRLLVWFAACALVLVLGE
jgi:hypothetical protein